MVLPPFESVSLQVSNAVSILIAIIVPIAVAAAIPGVASVFFIMTKLGENGCVIAIQVQTSLLALLALLVVMVVINLVVTF